MTSTKQFARQYMQDMMSTVNDTLTEGFRKKSGSLALAEFSAALGAWRR